MELFDEWSKGQPGGIYRQTELVNLLDQYGAKKLLDALKINLEKPPDCWHFSYLRAVLANGATRRDSKESQDKVFSEYLKQKKQREEMAANLEAQKAKKQAEQEALRAKVKADQEAFELRQRKARHDRR